MAARNNLRFAYPCAALFAFVLSFVFASSALIHTPIAYASDAADKSEVSLVAVGDDLIHENVYKSAKQKDGTYNFDAIFKHVKKDVSAADIAVINQETIFTSGDYSGYPCFGSPRVLGDSIAKAGFDVVQCATNHTMDRGTGAIETTLKYWKKKHPEIKVLGIHSSKKAASKITVIERNGIKIAMLNYTYGTNGIKVPSSKSYMVDRLASKSKIKSDIKRAKKLCDFVIVFPHFGTEYRYRPDDDQKMWTKFFADQGVDLMIGTHPHVLEPVKYVKGKKGNKMLAYYSLGNFVSNQYRIDTLLGGMAEVKIVKTAKGTRIKSYELTPLVTHKTGGRNGFTVYKLSDYTTKLAKRSKNRDNFGSSWSPSNLKRLYTKITGRKIRK